MAQLSATSSTHGIQKIVPALISILALQLALSSCSGCNHQTEVRVPNPHFAKGPGRRKLIVFVHGVLGDMDNTWINPATHASWPDLIVNDPDLKDFDVFVYGYSSPPIGQASNIREIADRFGQELKDSKIFANYEEVDFITHSMGGIITKRMLDTLNTPSENVEFASCPLRHLFSGAVKWRGTRVPSLMDQS